MSDEKFNPLKIAPGTMVGPYEIVELEADGGFGFLYRVRRDGKVYALKIGRYASAGMPPEDRERDEERLDREIAAMKTLRHPNIVRVLAFDRWPDLERGYPYLVMEFVEGVRLDEWQAASAASLAKIVPLYEKVALAVDHIHAHGIFHRDLKAQNVVVRDDGEPVVLDFGIARPRYAHEVTRAGTIGSVNHFAPEYVRWADSAASKTEPFQWQAATDLHSLGYMLYEALAGRPPFPLGTSGNPASEREVLLAIKKVVPARPSSLNPRVPPVLDELVMQLLAKDPAQRPASAGLVAEVLRQARESANAAGDRSWSEPFDSVSDGTAAPAAEESVVTRPSPPGEAAAAAGPDDGSPAASSTQGLAELIREGDSPEPVALPPPGGEADFIDEEKRADGDDKVAPPDPVADAVATAKAQVAASAPRRRMSPALLAGVVISGALAATLLIARWPTGSQAPKTLPATDAARQEPVLAVPPPPTLGVLDAHPEPGEPAKGTAKSEIAEESAGGSGGSPESSPGKSRRKVLHPPVPKTSTASTVDEGGHERAPLAVSQPLSPGTGILQRSQGLETAAQAPAPPKRRGVPYGSHVRARLLSNLDTRTIGSGPVEAILDAPHVVRGEIVLPSRTMAYGVATETEGRFTIRFSRLRLPDDTELPFEAIALARDDGKPGLAPSRRIARPPEQREGVGAKIAKGTGNILLDTITGGTAEAIGRNAGQTALNHESAPSAEGQSVLLLDAGVVFDLWVERAF